MTGALQRPARSRGSGWASLSLVLIFSLSLLIGGWWWVGVVATPRPPQPGDQAPEVALPTALGGTERLSQHRGSVVVLSFLDLGSAGSSTAADRTRGQLVMLKSLSTQHHDAPLAILTVDASGITWPVADDARINYTYDHQLTFPLLVDDQLRTTRRYGVVAAPTTLLIDRDGNIVRRWETMTNPADLMLSVDALLP